MHVHGDNLRQKLRGGGKYADAASRRFLKEIEREYVRWQTANEGLKGPDRNPGPADTDLIQQRTGLFTSYKDFIDQQKYAEKIDSRSTLHSTVLEEFM